MSNSTVDAHGRHVLAFMGRVRNLTRLGELVDSIAEIAASGDWRTYKTAAGTEKWLAAEFDYFLIACDVPFADVTRVLAYNRRGAELASTMDREARARRRRPIEKAAESWPSAGAEGLVERAQRLGWINKRDEIASPLPRSAQLVAAKGVTMTELARQNRARQIPAKRRRELDALVRGIMEQTAEPVEVRYVMDRLRDRVRASLSRTRCDRCGARIRSPRARYCSPTCQKAASRARSRR
jgi:hypothetical protein